MGIKYPGLLLVFLLPALISGASAAMYVENATAFNFSLNATPAGLNSSFDSVQPRIFTEDVDALLGKILNTTPSALNSSLNVVRPRIFTEHLDSILRNNLTNTPNALNSSLTQVRPRIFTEHLDTSLNRNLSAGSNSLDSSLAQIRPRIFTEHIDSILKQNLLSMPANNNSFNTGSGTYPSISGVHKGNITLTQNLTVHRLYTYPSPGRGGHSEYAAFYRNGSLIASGNWTGYQSDWHNITFAPFTLEANVTYNYTIRTGSYPQIIHANNITNSAGTMTSTEFIDANGRRYQDWIPAIRLE